MTKAKKAIETIEQQTGADNGAEIIGYQVWWDLHRAIGARVDLLAALTAVGLEWACPEELSPIKRMRMAGISAGRPHGVELKAAGRSGEQTTFRPVRYAQATDSAGQGASALTVDPSVLSSIIVHRESGATELQDPACPVGQAIVRQYEESEGSYIGSQIGRMLRDVLDGELHGVRLRRHGGHYYVPQNTDVEQVLRDLRGVVQGIGECDLYIERVAVGSDSARAATRGAMRSLDGQYAELLDAATFFATGLESGDLAHGRALNAKVEQAQSLKRQVEMYTSILDSRGVKLAKAATIVSDTVKKIVDASVDVRALNKAKESERAISMAKTLMTEIAGSAKKALAKATKLHEPVVEDNDDDE